MVWYCRFKWHPGTTPEMVQRRVLERHDSGGNRPEKIRSWYNLAGGGAGFMLIETDDPRELNEMLQPYMDLMSWDVHAVYELSYDATIRRFREVMQAAV